MKYKQHYVLKNVAVLNVFCLMAYIMQVTGYSVKRQYGLLIYNGGQCVCGPYEVPQYFYIKYE
jgi:hypothetical protein